MPTSTTRGARRSAARLADGQSLATLVRPQDGVISRRIFTDREICEGEEEQIFGRAWFYLCHETEIPNRGDLVTRPCGMDSAIVLRDDEGQIRAFLNSCRHAGMRLCRSDREENVRFLRCPYHGWSYRTSGALAAATNEHHYGPGELEKTELGLIPVAQLGTYQGLVFATWSDDAPPLDRWLGDMRWYMDIIFGRTGGIEVVGAPQVWEVECSWKFAAANFPDNVHVFSTHQSLVQLGLLPNDPDFACHGHIVSLANGHVLHFVESPPGEESFMGMGLPKALWPRFSQHLEPAQADIFNRHAVSVGTLWPNFHWLQLATAGDSASKPAGFLNLRLEVPLSPTRTRMYSWFAIDKAAPADYRKASYATYVHTFGPGGMFDQDDMETLEDCMSVGRGPAAKRGSLHQKMGLARRPDPEWPGPGTAYPDSYGEELQRGWYREWLRAMSEP